MLEAQNTQKLLMAILLAWFAMGTSACSLFKKKKSHASGGGGAIGESLGEHAGGADEARLQELYAIATAHAPAAVRPDPDTVVRQLLLQYRQPGATVAGEIGRVEKYRSLLGGASEDFAKTPQESYDATSLLATMTVAEEICEGLVAPDARNHPGWQTILPQPAADTDANIHFLMQRFQGIPSALVDATAAARLGDILASAKEGGAVTLNSYIPVCTTLMIDAEALLL